MARNPAATWVGEQSPKTAMSRYDVLCFHTIVGFAPAHAAHFSTKADGTILQSRDTKYRSDANLNGNHRVIAVENEDHGPAFPRWSGSDVPPLTDEQCESLARIAVWCHRKHGIPLVACPDSRPTSRGIAYHRQGIDGNFGSFAYPGRVQGGEVWTKWFGKACPGDRRIAQIPGIIARAVEIRDALRVVTYNLGDGPDSAKAADLDALVKAGAQVICLQEAGDRRRMLRRWRLANGWKIWRGLALGSGSVPILYDPDLEVSAKLSRTAVPRTPVGRGAGPSTAKAKAITGIRVRGTWVLNTHMVASAWQDNAAPERVAHYQRHLRALARIIERRRERGLSVLAVGDFNATTASELLDPLGGLGLGLHQQTREPTHGRRVIDLMWTHGLFATKRRVLDLSSDHKAVLATVKEKP